MGIIFESTTNKNAILKNSNKLVYHMIYPFSTAIGKSYAYTCIQTLPKIANRYRISGCIQVNIKGGLEHTNDTRLSNHYQVYEIIYPSITKNNNNIITVTASIASTSSMRVYFDYEFNSTDFSIYVYQDTNTTEYGTTTYYYNILCDIGIQVF